MHARFADPPISAALQHDDHGNDNLSRRLARPDPGLHHDADRAGGGERRRHRLFDLELDPGRQHGQRLYPAQLRPEPGADRRDGQGPAGQIPDARPGAGPDHPQSDWANHRRHVYRVCQRRAAERGDLGLSDPGGAAVAVDRRRRRLGRYSRRSDLCHAAVARPGAQSWTSSVMMNGQHAVFIGVQATPTGNPLSLVAGVRALLPEIQRNLPPSVKMQVAYDSTRFIQASIDEVKFSLGQAVVIVVVVIFLFLGSFRAVLIPVVTIPLSLIGAGIIMAALGFSLNLLTLLAMVLAIGLVVDDAIVVLENVYRHIEEGRSAAQAALIGAREIAGPIISMTLTRATVYTP